MNTSANLGVDGVLGEVEEGVEKGKIAHQLQWGQVDENFVNLN